MVKLISRLVLHGITTLKCLELDVDNFLLAFQEAGGVSLAESQIPTSIKNWPGRGNPLIASELYYNDGPLAPFFDFDDNGIYDPRKGRLSCDWSEG